MAKTIFGKVIEVLLSIFKQNFPKFIAGAYNKIPDELKHVADTAIKIVSKLAETINEYEVEIDAIVALIPGDTDDKLVAWLKENLPKIVAKFPIVVELDDYEKHGIATTIFQEYTGTSYGQAGITVEVVFQKHRKSVGFNM